MAMLPSQSKLLILSFTFLYPTIAAQKRPDSCEAESVTCPLDARSWAHITLMALSFGLIFPFGMVLGMVRSGLHIPVQIFGAVVATSGYILGHVHRGSTFGRPNIHSIFGKVFMLMLILQAGLGALLALERNKTRAKKVGRIGKHVLIAAHSWLGKLFPVMAWTQMLFGIIVALEFCREDHLGQCLSHFILGSSFIAVGIVMLIVLLVGQSWLQKTGKSQEFFESIFVAACGCFHTFAEHRWGTAWVKNDLQHTSMGIIWWCGGMLGTYLSYPRAGRGPQRNVLPALILAITGWVFTTHPQDLLLSAKVHAVFGWTLVGAGAARIIEISFIVRPGGGLNSEVNSWKHLSPLLYFAAGFLFMGANEEQIQMLSGAHVTHGAYALILYSGAFLLYLYVNILLHPFTLHTQSEGRSKRGEGFFTVQHEKRQSRRDGCRALESQHKRDAEDSNLKLLVSDGESDD